MAKAKRNGSLTGILKNILQAYLKRISDISYLFTLEAQLAGKSLVNIILLVIFGLFLLGSCWLSVLLILFLFLVYLQFSYLFSAIMVLLLNLISLIVIYLFIHQNKKNLSFSATRRQVANLTSLNKDSYHE